MYSADARYVTGRPRASRCMATWRWASMKRTSQSGSWKPSGQILTMCGRWPAAATASMNTVSRAACSSCSGLSKKIRSNFRSTEPDGGSSKVATTCRGSPGRSAAFASTRTIAVTSASVSASASIRRYPTRPVAPVTSITGRGYARAFGPVPGAVPSAASPAARAFQRPQHKREERAKEYHHDSAKNAADDEPGERVTRDRGHDDEGGDHDRAGADERAASDQAFVVRLPGQLRRRGRDVGGDRLEFGVGSERLADPLVELVLAQPALHERRRQRLDYLLVLVAWPGRHGCLLASALVYIRVAPRAAAMG
jgi:hypothetical protein